MDHSYFTEREKVQKTDHCYFTIARKTPAVVLRKAQLQMSDPTLQLLTYSGRPPVDQDHSYTRVDLSSASQTDLKIEDDNSDYSAFTESCPVNSSISLNEGHSVSVSATSHSPAASTSRLASLCLAAASECDDDRLFSTSNWDYSSSLVVNAEQELWISALKRFDEEKQKNCSSFVVTGDNLIRAISQNTREQLMDIESIQVAHTIVDNLDLAELHVKSDLRMKRLKSVEDRQSRNISVSDFIEQVDETLSKFSEPSNSTPTQDVDMTLSLSNLENQHLNDFNVCDSLTFDKISSENEEPSIAVKLDGVNRQLEERESEGTAEHNVKSRVQDVVSSQMPFNEVLADKKVALNQTLTFCPMEYTTFCEYDTVFVLEEDRSGILNHLFEDSNAQILQTISVKKPTIVRSSGKELDDIDSLIRDISLDHPYDMCLTPKPHRRQCPSAYTMISEQKTAELAAARMRQKISRMKNSNHNITRNSLTQIHSELLIEDPLDVNCSDVSLGNYVESDPENVCLKSPSRHLIDSFEACLSSSLSQCAAFRTCFSSHKTAITENTSSRLSSSQEDSADVCESNSCDTYSVTKEHSYLGESENISQRFNPSSEWYHNDMTLASLNKYRSFGSQGSHLDDHSYLNSKEQESGLHFNSHRCETRGISYDDSCINSATKLHDHTYLAKYNTDSDLSVRLNILNEDMNNSKSANREGLHNNFKVPLDIDRSVLISSDIKRSNEISWNMEICEAGDVADSHACMDIESVKSIAEISHEPLCSNLKLNFTGNPSEDCCKEIWNSGNVDVGNPPDEVADQSDVVDLHEDQTTAADVTCLDGEEVTVGCVDILTNSPDGVELEDHSPGDVVAGFHSPGRSGLNDHSYHAIMASVRQTVPLTTMAT